jgi:hypothetical protein
MDILSHLDSSASGATDVSVFEIIGKDKMNELLQPAFDQMLTRATERFFVLYPFHKQRKLLYVLLMSGIQYHYLTEWGLYLYL